MKLLIALIASALLVSACSMQQNPLEGAGDQVANGNLPDTNPPPRKKPIDKHNMQLDYPAQIEGRVGAPVEFKITGRMLIPDVPYQIIINNLDMFPGATYDSATGIFKWVPNREIMAGRYRTSLPLHVIMYTLESSPSSPAQQSEEWFLKMDLEMDYSKPSIVSLTADPVVTGGSTYRFPIVIEDLDATSREEINLIPRDCKSSISYSSISALLDLSYMNLMKSPTVPGRWEGHIVLNLRQTAGLKSGSVCFGLQTYSKVGVASNLFEQRVIFEPEIKSSRSTLDNEFVISQGEVKEFYFTVYDAEGQSNVTVTKIDELKMLPGSKVECTTQNSDRSVSYCVATLDARTATAGTWRYYLEAETKSRHSDKRVKTNHLMRVNVKAVVSI